MASDEAHLILKIETAQPVELSEFIAAFIGFGNQFERFYDEEHLSQRGNARFYVREVRAGSIIAELVPALIPFVPMLGEAMTGVKYANDLAKFVENYGKKIRSYFKRGGRDQQASKGDLADYLKTVQAIAHDSAGSLSLTAYEQGDQRVAFAFSTSEAREAKRNIIAHRSELDRTTDADHKRVLMILKRTNVVHATTGKRSGEWSR